jgi:hypothetical protein
LRDANRRAIQGDIGVHALDQRGALGEQRRQAARSRSRAGPAARPRRGCGTRCPRSGRHSPRRCPTAWPRRCPARSPPAAADADARQAGGGVVQRLDREADAGRDHAAQVVADGSTTSKVVAVPKSTTINGPS